MDVRLSPSGRHARGRETTTGQPGGWPVASELPCRKEVEVPYLDFLVEDFAFVDFFSVVFLVVVFAAISLGSFGGKKQVPVPNSCLSLAPGEEKQRENATLHMWSESILNELNSLLTVPLVSKWETTVKQKSRNPNVLSKIFMSQLAHGGNCRSDVTDCDTLWAKDVPQCTCGSLRSSCGAD